MSRNLVDASGRELSSVLTKEKKPMEVMNLRDFEQLAGIVQITLSEEVPDAIMQQYSKYLDMDQGKREQFIKTLLVHSKPAILKLAALIKSEEV